MDLKHKDVQDFINRHLNYPAADLILQASKFPKWDMKLIAQQLVGKQLAKNKLPLWFKNDDIQYPKRLSMEQCSSETTALYKSSIVKGSRGIDVTGGFGVDTYFFAIKTKSLVYCEQNKELAHIVKHNLEVLKQKETKVFFGDGIQYIKDNKPSDWIYIDPVRRKEGQRVFRLQDCEPNVISLKNLFFEKSNQILIKTSPLLDIKQTLQDLESVKEVHVISVNNDCKEVLYLLEKGFKSETQIHCANFKKDTFEKFSVRLSEEQKSVVEYSEPKSYIYEANSAVMKAGAFKAIATRYGLKKLHKNSHLYTSDKLISDFPGRSFKCSGVISPDKKNLAKLGIQNGNLACRNYPQKVDVLKKKLKLKDGGDHYIFATTLLNSKQKLLLCKKV